LPDELRYRGSSGKSCLKLAGFFRHGEDVRLSIDCTGMAGRVFMLSKRWFRLGACLTVAMAGTAMMSSCTSGPRYGTDKTAFEQLTDDLGQSTSLTGTEPDVLADVLQERYRTNGLTAKYRAFKNLDELACAVPAVAVLQFNALQDHCVTVLGVQTNGILVADPLIGLELVPKDEFERKWQFVGVVFKREGVAH